MSDLRPFALVRTGDQWARCSFDRTNLDVEAGVIELAWTTATTDSAAPAPTIGAGLALDNECRVYHSVVSDNSLEVGRVDRILWKATDPLGPVASQPSPKRLFQGQPDAALGDFSAGDVEAPLVEPRGLAVDVNDRLFVADTGADRILVYDLWSDRLLRRVALPRARPTDLAAHGTGVFAVLSGTRQLVRLTARSGPDPVALPSGCTTPSRVAVSPAGRLAVLDSAGTLDARVLFADATSAGLSAEWATDIEWESESVLVIARRPGADFLRVQVHSDQAPVQLPSLRAREYDGLGIVATPATAAPGTACTCGVSRRIGYWTGHGFRNAVPARLIFNRVGRVTTFRLDSGAYQTVWGRLFIDACIPAGADLRAHCLVLDEADDETAMTRVAPANIAGVTVAHPDLSPPLPPVVAVPGPDEVGQRLHLRESGRELPWTQPAAGDRFRTYEAPINAPAGRYLWITLELSGNTRVSPKVQGLRAEHPAHDYLGRLPRTFSRDPQAASFLLRYLAMFEGFLGNIEARSVERDLLLDPCSAPDECLPWLASFVGLTLDERWAMSPAACCTTPADARRRIIKEATWLFRYRGTVHGLKRFIELYVGVPVIVIEHFRMRGLGAVTLGEDPSVESSSVVGMGFQIGGAVGSAAPTAAMGTIGDAFRTHAHRFTVIVPAPLTEGQLDVVKTIIDVHRPAHTMFDVCTAGAGMRVGRGLMLEISSSVGPTGAFSTFQIGDSVLGRGAIVGRPPEGATVGSGRLGPNLRVG
ncbi:MAG: phage tail protein [Acidobacteriota bacterium]